MTTHLAARLVWHDRAWDGHVCDHPSRNAYCVVHEHVRDSRNDAEEDGVAAEELSSLPGRRPPCSRDPFAFSSIGCQITHRDPLEREGLLPVAEEMPPYSVCPSPYRWMREDAFLSICDAEQLDIRGPSNKERTKGWVSEPDRQTALLDCFWGKLEKGRSLVFLYCKDGHPLNEEDSTSRRLARILVGAGRISGIGPQLFFGSAQPNPPERFPIWSRRITHDFENEGFRLPYQEYLAQELDLSSIACPVSDADTLAFSYVAEHVTDDVAVGALERLLQSLQVVVDEGKVPGEWDRHLDWLNDALSEVWSSRGPMPGIGSVLQYLGFRTGTAFQRQVLSPLVARGEDPWQYTLALLEGRQACEEQRYQRPLQEAAKRWASYQASRRELLGLLARFELSPAQVQRVANPDERQKAAIAATDEELISNPYLICERDEGGADREPIGLEVIDRGMRPEGQAAVLLGREAAIAQDDARRVRAVATDVLKGAALEGDTLLRFPDLYERITERFPERRACKPDRDLILGEAGFYNEALDLRPDGDPPTVALRYLSGCEDQVSTALCQRLKRGKKPPPKGWGWEPLLKAEFEAGGADLPPEVEDRARAEKAEALDVLLCSRFSVLTGRAGTGKTSVLKVFLKGLAEVEGQRQVLLLAPTGKARVRLFERTEREAFTIHQFLMRHKWINPDNFVLRQSGGDQQGAPTVIIDEASMIPMDLLGVLFQALDLNKVERLILVGDPNQLPPIGPGRPFVDIITWLESSDEGRACLARLTERARHEQHDSQALRLADCFLRDDPAPGDDEILSLVARQEVDGDLEPHFWLNTDQLETILAARMRQLLGLTTEGTKDYIAFNRSLGVGGKGEEHDPKGAERWQILSPVRGGGSGIIELNRKIQLRYRQGMIDKFKREHPGKHLGDQQIVYPDKVIQCVNERRRAEPQGAGLGYVANGEVGIVVKMSDWSDTLGVAFSTQPEVTYGYYRSQVDERLELAYAMTVHRAQGSDFDVVFVILPQGARTLSRELLYTALTRFRKQTVLLMEKDTSVLEELRSPERSDTLLRNTNLFELLLRPHTKDEYRASSLLHCTRTRVLVRSKSEVIVANILTDLGISYDYEKRLPSKDNPDDYRLPDFTVSYQGDTYYWEHLGMLSVPSYREQWERKREWYEVNGYAEQLITSEDSPDGGIDSSDIEKTARQRILLED